MLHNRNIPQQPQNGNMVVSDSGMGVHVMGEQLREVNAPIEGLVGAGRGAVNGAVLGVAASLARTYAASEGQGLNKKIAINNITSTHVGMIMGITAAFAALSGFIRYSRAAKHNEWSQKHYDFLNAKVATAASDAPQGFAEREEGRKASAENRQIGA
jgi:hypothetical protein